MSTSTQQFPLSPGTRRSLGAVILHRRAELGLTQAALAERVVTLGDWGFRQSDISRLERGIVKLPHYTRMKFLAAALEMPVGELLARSGWTGADNAFDDSSTASPPASADEHHPSSAGMAAGESSSSERGVEIRQLRQELARVRQGLLQMQATLDTCMAVLDANDDERRS
jgi:transcriptional regulator with XRE-family HTH domain